jgi:hypothetical protein
MVILARQVLYHLCHALSPLCFSFFLPEGNLPTYAIWVAETTEVKHCTWPLPQFIFYRLFACSLVISYIWKQNMGLLIINDWISPYFKASWSFLPGLSESSWLHLRVVAEGRPWVRRSSVLSFSDSCVCLISIIFSIQILCRNILSLRLFFLENGFAKTI